VLLVIVAAVSSLIGFAIGRGTAGRSPQTAQVQQEAVSGEEVGFRGREFFDIRFYEGPHTRGNYVYWLEGERGDAGGDRWMISCCGRRYPVVFSVHFTDRNEANVHAGISQNSPIKFHLEDGTAYVGNNNRGPAVWSLCGGGNVCLGKGGSRPHLYHIEGEQVFPGGRVSTDVLLTADARIDNDPIIKLITPILVQELWRQW